MTDYRYLFADALTGQLIEELPLDCQSYSQQISGVGQWTGTLAIADPNMPTLWKQATLEKRSLLMIQRGDNPQPAWGGIVMKNRPTGTGHTTAEITAETLEGYWGRRKIKQDLTQTGADLFNVVRAIISQLQAITGGNLRMAVTSNLHGSTTTITYLGKDRTRALDAINRLAEVASFEYTITWNRTGNTFTPTLVLAAPGLATTLDPVSLEFPGNLAAPIDTPSDGGDAPNAVTGIGSSGTAGAPLISEAADTTGELAAGYPIFEDEIQFRDETDQTRLDARTQTALNAKLADHTVPTVELRPPERDTDLNLGDLVLGLPVRLRCTCPYHPAGTDGRPGYDTTSRRITGWTVAPKAAEKVTLALGGITGKITPPLADRSVAAYIRDLDRRIRELATRT
ncbi:MAG: hypothetical protein JWO67_5405 [Streptosporangiaceae bacterium]|nr:hypothetical protein [Streptosporangiaceae bacterium]